MNSNVKRKSRIQQKCKRAVKHEGRRKQVKVASYPEATALARMLEGLDFPTNKDKIIAHIEQRAGDNTADENVLMKLQRIEDRQYEKVAEIAKNAGLVYWTTN